MQKKKFVKNLLTVMAVVGYISFQGCATYVSSECLWYEPIDIKSTLTQEERINVDYNNLMYEEAC